jgi:hypothetical protein
LTVPPHILSTRSLYDGWTTLRLVQLRLESGEVIQREVEDHGNAVAVLPFDPVRRTALLVRGLRAPALLSAGHAAAFTIQSSRPFIPPSNRIGAMGRGNACESRGFSIGRAA